MPSFFAGQLTVIGNVSIIHTITHKVKLVFNSVVLLSSSYSNTLVIIDMIGWSKVSNVSLNVTSPVEM